jgi:hypothetical protein
MKWWELMLIQPEPQAHPFPVFTPSFETGFS